ncbi:MAG: N-acetylglutaminylglutamine synthetase [Puniceicoccaceae bacterium]
MTDSPDFEGVTLQCGWGRLIFAHTFPSPAAVAREILREQKGQRDIAFYLNDPHLVLNEAPQDLFLDPSLTYRLRFGDYAGPERAPAGFEVGPVRSRDEIAEINRIYISHKMVPVDADYLWRERGSPLFRYLVARALDDGRILGVVLGVDHRESFSDIENGSSLWALAVDKQADLPGVGECLVRATVEEMRERGRIQLDLSVMHDNEGAIGLYRKLGFHKVAVFAVKCRNSINERLFIGDPPDPEFNPYAEIIINEALRRGIRVSDTDPARGFFTLSLGGRSVTCRESLTEMTSAVAVMRCDDKSLTRELLERAGLQVPAQQRAADPEADRAFLERHGRIVVKPVRGEQGKGVSVDIRTPEDMEAAVREARESSPDVILEAFATGLDLRIIVINHEVVAAALRKPAEITGTGKHTVRELIERLSRRRAAATGGESRIPQDDETERCLRSAGIGYDTVPAEGETIPVRKAANLHTGGTIHDVTPVLNPVLADAAIRAAAALAIPVVGLDFIVPDAEGGEYVIIEANERPGLANHEPQPAARKLVDFLFPHSIQASASR